MAVSDTMVIDLRRAEAVRGGLETKVDRRQTEADGARTGETAMRAVALAVVMVGVSLAAGEPEKRAAPGAKLLWAAISVSHPVFDPEVRSQDPFLLHLALVNDVDKTIDPELDSSQLIVNGKEVGGDWSFT